MSKVITFSDGYYLQSRNGKRVRVRKGRHRMLADEDIRTGLTLGGAALGFTTGSALGNKLIEIAGRNGRLQNLSIAAGAALGAGIGGAISHKILYPDDRRR